MPYMFFIILFFLSLTASSQEAYTQTSLTQKKKELQSIQSTLSQTNKDTLKAQKAITEQKKEIETTKKQLIEQNKKTREQEALILKTSKRIDSLKAQEEKETELLKTERQALSVFFIALQRLANTPAQSLLVKPEAPIKTARAQRVLQNTMAQIQEKTKTINAHIASLQQTKTELRKKKLDLEDQKNILSEKQKNLENLIAKKNTQLSSTESELENYRKETKKLALNADNLQDLVVKLEAEEQISGLSFVPKKPKRNTAAVSSVFSLKEGSYLPVVGHVSRNYGEKNEFGVTNKGIEIEGKHDSTVTTPFSGTIKFAGPFKHYQKIIIIEHPDNKISLIGGLKKLYTKTGQYVDSGEPIGTLGGFRGASSTLYYELRDRGKQIDPQKYLMKLAKAAQKT